MTQTVYVDLYFLINFSMDFLCFFLTSKLLSAKLSFGRTLVASTLGGIYANLALFLPVSVFFSLVIDMGVCALMCAVALVGRSEARRLPLYALVYIAVSMVLGGSMTALFHLFNRLNLPLGNIAPDGPSVWLLALLAILGGLITYACGRFFSGRAARRHARLTVKYENKSCSVDALCDTGNLLRDPIGGRSCIVVERERLRDVLPDELLLAASHGASPTADLLARYTGRVRLIPAQTATGTRTLLGFRPDHITVDARKGPHTVDALIVPSTLNHTADALIPPELLL